MGALKEGNVITHPALQGKWLVAGVKKSDEPLWNRTEKYMLHPVMEGKTETVYTDTTLWVELSNIFSDTVKLHPPTEVEIVGDCTIEWSDVVTRSVAEKPFAKPTNSDAEECALPF